METILVVQYKKLEYLPPVMSLIQGLKTLGEKVVYIGVGSPVGERFLKQNEIEFRFVPNFNPGLYKSTCIIDKIINRIRRAIAFYPHRLWLKRVIQEYYEVSHGKMIIWHSEIRSAALLGDWGSRFKRRVVSIFELGDYAGKGWLGFSLQKFLKNVKVVVPEPNRARIMQSYFKLPYTPMVIANKPFEHPRLRHLKTDNRQFEKVLEQIKNRPIFLYQGVWSDDRSSVFRILEVIAEHRPNYCILTMPSCPAVAMLSERYSNVYSMPFIDPPHHLEITSYATVGIAVYNSSGKSCLERLNAVYCAPNKIYEYAGFGIPILCNNMPGLRYTVESFGAGCCIDENDMDAILKAADDIIMNYKEYSKSAVSLFEAEDILDSIRKVLAEV